MPMRLPQGHGFCNEGRDCKRSHDLDVILDFEMEVKNGNGRPKKKQKSENQSSASSSAFADEQSGGADRPPETSESPKPANGISHDNPSETATDTIPTPTSTSEQTISQIHISEPPSFTTVTPPQSTDATLFENYHSACFDAYMTGYIWAHQLLLYGKEKMETYKNNMYLIGKQIPLRIEKSRFARTSSGHREKRERVLAGRRVFGIDVRRG